MKKRNPKYSLAKQTIKIYWQATKKYKGLFILMVVVRPMYILSTYLANVLLTGMALDRLAEGGPYDFYADFGWIIIGLVGFGVAQILLEFLSVRTIWTLNVKVRNDLGMMCYERLMNESADFHANRFAGSMVSQTNKFVGSYDRLLETLHWQVYALFIFIVMTVAVLAPRIPVYTLILVLILSLYFIISLLANNRARELSTKLSEAENKATGQLADSIGNVMAVKSFSAEEVESKRYRLILENIKDKDFSLRDYAIKKDFFIGVPLTSSIILAVVFSIVAAERGIAPLSTLLLATAFTRDLFQRVREFNVNSLRNIAKSIGDSHEMTEILLSPKLVVDDDESAPMNLGDSSIIFKDVSFNYKEKELGNKLFENLNLELKPFEKIGLVGPSGGGKSTITKLLLRFMDVQDGQILIGGQDISKVGQKELRKHIAYVPQEPLLFHRSLFDNIRYGKPTATDAEVKQAAKLANADEFIESLPMGYETLVGERGIKLSGGQKQRVAIARTIIKDSPILVLDEATSALDSESEHLIQSALAHLMKGKTTIVIAHRLSTIQKMDRIIVLDNGEIVEQGSHSELKDKKNGLYARLWKHQSGGFLQD
ncbi:ABC transporter ATP-binding protein [Candidatus Saccharibacteria bacterium]|jgi:ATP-binding cassette subfamily B protein|nr:ABC transporter ATP-binding protein [Candidatus Saccharibacteria bacterium]